jgi:hypothetical protein
MCYARGGCCLVGSALLKSYLSRKQFVLFVVPLVLRLNPPCAEAGETSTLLPIVTSLSVSAAVCLILPQVVAGEIGTCQISYKMKEQLGMTQHHAGPEADEWVAEGARPVDAATEYDLAAPAVAQAAAAAAAGQPPAKKRKK